MVSGAPELKEIVIAVVFIGILLAVFIRINEFSNASSKQSMCRLSILKAWKSSSFSITNPLGQAKNIIRPSFSGCKTSYARIDKKGITKDKRTIYDFSGYKGRDCDKRENETMKFLADEIASCWSTFGKGDFDFATIYKKVYNSKDFICYVCTQLYVSELPCGNISFERFENFLKDRTIIINNGNSEVSYYNYLYGDYNDELKNMQLNSLNTPNPSPNYEMDIPADYTFSLYQDEAKMIKSGLPISEINNPDQNITEGHTYYILFQVIGPPISSGPIPVILLVDLKDAFINCEKMFS